MIKKISLKAVLISSLISLCYFKSASTISNDNQTNIKIIEYKEKEANDKYYDVSNNIVDNSLLVTCKSKFSKDMLSDIDYVSIKDDEINKYVGKEITYKSLYDVENMKFSLDTIVDDESFKIEGKLILNDDNNFSIIIKTDDKEYDVTTLYDKNSVDSVCFFSWLRKSLSRLAFNAIAIILPSAIADMIYDVCRTILGETNIISSLVNISKAITNYNHNRYLKEPTEYIYNQDNYKSYWMGAGANIDRNGCGIVSIYNSLYSFNRRTNLKDLILRCDLLNAYTLNTEGHLGVDPNSIANVCLMSGLRIRKKYGRYNNHDNSDAFSNDVNIYCKDNYAILMVINNLDNFFDTGMHYFNVRYDENIKIVKALNYQGSKEKNEENLSCFSMNDFFTNKYPEDVFVNGYIFYE